ncbi:MAG: MmgE/PrpD family protein [Burkholderiales bacterium]|nr:MmgE/PrpD family protein [Burkholderiales bacterium]
MSTSYSQDDLTGLTLRFADHIANLRFEDLPESVVNKAKLILRDGMGNQIAASAIGEPAIRMVDLVREWGGAPQATVIGFGFKVPLPHAAMCNAMMGHGVELDDAHGSGLIKAGSVLVPTANAIAEFRGIPGKEVITALVAGYELAIRVAKAINPGHRSRGYHTTGTVSCLGAAAMGARLLGCNAEQIAWAIGLAGMQSAGIQSYLDDPCIAKPFSPGKSAFNGTIAAVMASRGFSGPKKVLESREGFFNAFTDSVRVADLLDGLGSEYAIMEVGFKPHAACRYAHGPIDLAQDLYWKHGVRVGDVETVTVHMSTMAIRQASKPKVTNLNAAMGSTQFGVALALETGANGLRDYWSGYENRNIHDVASSKVTLVAEEEFGLTGRQAIVEIDTKDGRHLQLRSEEPRGEPNNPLTEVELERKFKGLASMVMKDSAAVDSISRRIMALESETNAGVLPSLSVAVDGKPVLLAA